MLMLEKDRDIGMPVRCGEAIGIASLKMFHTARPEWIKTKLTRIKIVAPDLTEVAFDLVPEAHGYILDRRVFDYDLAHFAAQAGADVVTKAYVNGLIIEDDMVCGVKGTHMSEPFELRAKLVVGADGVESRVGRWAGLRTQLKLKDVEPAIQKTISGIDCEPHVFEFHMSRQWAPGGYVWVFPKGSHAANVGLGISGIFSKEGKSAQQYLDEFLERKYPDCAVLTTVTGGVPVAKTLKQLTADGLMLIGDAGRTVNPMTGGGISSGMHSGLVAAETAVAVLKNGKSATSDNLKPYEKAWHDVGGKAHERLYRIKEAVYKFSDNDLNRIAEGVMKIPENDRNLLKLFSVAVKKKPTLLLDVARLFTGF